MGQVAGVPRSIAIDHQRRFCVVSAMTITSEQLTVILDALLYSAQNIRGGGNSLEVYKQLVNDMLQQQPDNPDK